MSKNLPTPTPDTETTDLHSGTSGLAPDALARRRMLLKSLGKGSSVIAAAAIPMHTLAGTGTLALASNNKRCTVSSMASAVHSKETTSAACTGRKPSSYNTPDKWPNVSKQGNIYTVSCAGIASFTNSSSFMSVFGGTISASIGTIMSGTQNPNEMIWMTALFNAMVGVTGVTATGVNNFPYTPKQVVDLYKSTSKADAMDFFQKYLQSA